ncbi:MAG: Pr6Pr family membrane protein [Candidatus Lokiarchaeota archaeon]|nr:Pr6Pr family membrane protein [Candidatus Lokiarchaeota archaeon]
MKNITITDKNILIYRIIFTALSWFTIVTGTIISTIENLSILPWFNGFITFTMQTNLLVTIWLTLAILWHKKPQLLEKIRGVIKGAFTLYITITFVFFAILLSPIYQPTELYPAFSNLVLHYITPIAFIVDWVLTETKIRYEWKYLGYWITYPIGYLVFAFLHGTFTGNYIYFFLDIEQLGIMGYTLFITVLIISGLVLGSLYIAVNRKRIKI